MLVGMYGINIITRCIIVFFATYFIAEIMFGALNIELCCVLC